MRFTKRRDEWLLGPVDGEAGARCRARPCRRSEPLWPGSRSARSSAGRHRGHRRCFVDGVRYEHRCLADRPRRLGRVCGRRCRRVGLRSRARRTAFRPLRPRYFLPARAGRSRRSTVRFVGRRRRQPHLVRQGERVEGAAHRPPPRHAVGRGRAPRASRPSRAGSPLGVRVEEGSRTARLVAAVRRVPAHRCHRPAVPPPRPLSTRRASPPPRRRIRGSPRPSTAKPEPRPDHAH